MSRVPPGDQFGPHDPFNEPKRSGGSSLLKWVLILVGVAVVGGVVICCGGGYWAWQATTTQMASEVQGRLETDPVILEHIGEIESLEVNLTKTGEGEGLMAFDIRGSQGSGTVYVGPGGAHRVGGRHEGERLVMADGEVYPLAAEGRPEPAPQPVEPQEEPQEVIIEDEEFVPADR